MMDEDKDGKLTIDELTRGLENVSDNVKPKDLAVILETIDTDGSGMIDYTEFIAATLDIKGHIQRRASQNVLWQAFRVFDKDGDGVITRDELQHMMAEGDVAAALEEADLNGDGTISFDEFCGAML